VEFAAFNLGCDASVLSVFYGPGADKSNACTAVSLVTDCRDTQGTSLRYTPGVACPWCTYAFAHIVIFMFAHILALGKPDCMRT